jgi:hypothetical protein
MKTYEVPVISPYQRPFWIAAASSVAAFLAIWAISALDPVYLPDSAAHPIGIIAVVVVFACILGAVIFGALEGEWKLKRRLSVTVSENSMVQKRDGKTVDLSIDEIKSAFSFRGYLIIVGGEPSRRIIVPKAIIGYEEFRRELGGRVTEP